MISFFGIRGLGTVYYLAYAPRHGEFEAPDLLWSAASLVVLVSIVLHGVTVTPVMRYLDRRAADPARQRTAEGDADRAPAPAERPALLLGRGRQRRRRRPRQREVAHPRQVAHELLVGRRFASSSGRRSR